MDTSPPAGPSLAIRRVPLDALHLDPANARSHGPVNLDAIEGSLSRFGQAEPLIVQAGTGRVIAGSRVPAAQLDGYVMDRVRLVGKDDALIEATARAAEEERDAQRRALRADTRRHKTRLAQLEAERARLQAADQNGHTADRLVTIANEIEDATRAHHQAGADLKALASVPTDEAALRAALATLDDIWDSLFPHERARLLGLLISEVRVFAAEGEVEMDIRNTGIEALREELADEVIE